MIFSVIAGSCAIKTHKPRQVREEAAVVILFMCMGLPGYPFFKDPAADMRTGSFSRLPPPEN